MQYFIYANSFAAPFCSDTSTDYVTAESPAEALELFAAMYRHPCGLFCASAFASADDYHKGKQPLAQWHSNRLAAELRAKEGKSCYVYIGHSAGHFEIDGQHYHVENPKAGSVAVQ